MFDTAVNILRAEKVITLTHIHFAKYVQDVK